MKNEVTKKIALIGILSALYFVFSLTLKIPMGVGSIALDLGYIVLTVAAWYLGAFPAAIVGGLGALIESVLLSPYGISYGWIVMNVIIGLGCGFIFSLIKNKDNTLTLRKMILCGITIVVMVLVGVTAKTIIECTLYSIPYIAKIPKSLVAFGIDSVVMIIGLPIARKLKNVVEV